MGDHWWFLPRGCHPSESCLRAVFMSALPRPVGVPCLIRQSIAMAFSPVFGEPHITRAAWRSSHRGPRGDHHTVHRLSRQPFNILSGSSYAVVVAASKVAGQSWMLHSLPH